MKQYMFNQFAFQTVAYNVRNEDALSMLGVNVLLNIRGGSLFVTKKVSEMLFDGYDDTLLNFLQETNSSLFYFPFNKFGWFVDRNGSWSYDGVFNMNNGEIDINKLGTLHLWNGESKSNFYSNTCSKINGTTGRVWPPNLNAEEDITVFLPDICRSISLAAQNLTTQESKWISDERIFDNGESYPPNICFCTGAKCPDLKPGVLNVSDCQFGSPGFVSHPHFYLADPSFYDAVDGLNPSKEKHEFSITLNSTNGMPFELNNRLQMNILLQPINGLT